MDRSGRSAARRHRLGHRADLRAAPVARARQRTVRPRRRDSGPGPRPRPGDRDPGRHADDRSAELATVRIDRSADLGSDREPNGWLIQPEPQAGPPGPRAAVTGFPQPSRVATRIRSETVEAAPAARGPCEQVEPEHVQPDDPDASPSRVIPGGSPMLAVRPPVAAPPGSSAFTATTSVTPRLSRPVTFTLTPSLAATPGPVGCGLGVLVGDGVGDPVGDGARDGVADAVPDGPGDGCDRPGGVGRPGVTGPPADVRLTG